MSSPNPKWRRPRMKLGDKVSAIAQPIAHVIDAVAGTNLKNCSSCARRRETLNNLDRPA